ncbi:hypothetical protein D9M68_987680 [compost metagenome]
MQQGFGRSLRIKVKRISISVEGGSKTVIKIHKVFNAVVAVTIQQGVIRKHGLLYFQLCAQLTQKALHVKPLVRLVQLFGGIVNI